MKRPKSYKNMSQFSSFVKVENALTLRDKEMETDGVQLYPL